MFSGKAFNSVTRPLFHDANSKRGGVLMHANGELHIWGIPEALGNSLVSSSLEDRLLACSLPHHLQMGNGRLANLKRIRNRILADGYMLEVTTSHLRLGSVSTAPSDQI